MILLIDTTKDGQGKLFWIMWKRLNNPKLIMNMWT